MLDEDGRGRAGGEGAKMQGGMGVAEDITATGGNQEGRGEKKKKIY